MKPSIYGIIFDWSTLFDIKTEELFPYSSEVVKRLSEEFNIGVVGSSNNGESPESIREQIENSEISGLLDSVEVSSKKVKAYVYLDCVNYMDTADISIPSKPENVVVVDTILDRGIKIGKELGFSKGYFVTNDLSRSNKEYKRVLDVRFVQEDLVTV